MQRFRDGLKTSPPALPVFWQDPENSHKIYWDTQREYWLGFMKRINDYTDGNGKSRVAESEVEAQICQQFPKWACDGDPENPFPAALGPTPKGGGCGACGRR